MPLRVGIRLGHYDITAKIGEGGMGEVYQARDTKLDHDVALKVLPDAFTADPDRLVRFQREAKVLASLNHPNIGEIYGLEAEGDTQALVLELIEGPTLADRIAEGPIPVDEALDVPPHFESHLGLESDHPEREIGREEAIYGSADHRVPAGGRGRPPGEGPVPPARVLGGQLLPLAEQVWRDECLGREAPESA